jgi:hypothetical protein
MINHKLITFHVCFVNITIYEYKCDTARKFGNIFIDE